MTKHAQALEREVAELRARIKNGKTGQNRRPGVVVVNGNEAHGKYVELLDTGTGRTVANKKFDRNSN
jgi:hypothetical protein